MKRENVRLYRENYWTRDRRMLSDTVLPTDPVPLTVEGGIVGMVTDVHRGRRGWVLGTLHSRWLGEDLDLTDLACQAEFSGGTWQYARRNRIIMDRAHLRGVRVGTNPCWKGMWIK